MEELMTNAQAAAIFGISSAALRSLFARGKPQEMYGLHYMRAGRSGIANLLDKKQILKIKKDLDKEGRRFCKEDSASLLSVRAAALLLGVQYERLRYMIRAGYLEQAGIMPKKVRRGSFTYLFYAKKDLEQRGLFIRKPHEYKKKSIIK